MASDKYLQNSVSNLEVFYAMPEENEVSLLVTNLMQFPESSKRYSQAGTSLGGVGGVKEINDDPMEAAFAFEDPTLTAVEALEPTSGRKAWMLKHGKRIKKKLKADKRGYIGS